MAMTYGQWQRYSNRKFRGKHTNRRSYCYYYNSDQKVVLPLDSFRIDVYDESTTGEQWHNKDSKTVYFYGGNSYPDAKYEKIGGYTSKDFTDDEIIKDISNKIYINYSFAFIYKIYNSRLYNQVFTELGQDKKQIEPQVIDTIIEKLENKHIYKINL